MLLRDVVRRVHAKRAFSCLLVFSAARIMNIRARLIALACFGGLSTIWSTAHATQSGTWHSLNNPICTDVQPCFSPSAPLLLTDGTVIMHDQCGSLWFRLTPISMVAMSMARGRRLHHYRQDTSRSISPLRCYLMGESS